MSSKVLQSEAVAIPEALHDALTAVEKLEDEAERELTRTQAKLFAPVYSKRKEVIKQIPGFWHQVLVNNLPTNIHIADADHDALSHLTDIDVTLDEKEVRKVNISFTFSENAFFSETTLTRSFNPADDAPTASDDFNPIEDWTSEKVTISWKDDEHNLPKQNPTKTDEEEFEPGSFFGLFFESESNATVNSLAHSIANDMFGSAILIYKGEYSGNPLMDDFDMDEDDFDDEEDDDEEEIDLEKEDGPAKKKAKTE